MYQSLETRTKFKKASIGASHKGKHCPYYAGLIRLSNTSLPLVGTLLV